MAISEEKPPEEQPLYGGRYEIKSVDSSTLPEGVIEAFDAETRQLVHIKELPDFAESADVEDFLPQAELVARLKHQNLIRVMDFGTTESQIPFLVFEKFQGSNLFEYLQENGQFKLKEGLEFCEKAIEGIEYLHSKGVMHGSLSLLNVHPFKELSFMPLNLKISGLLDIYPNEYREYDDSELPIEPFYSPEQLESEEVDFRSDVFSLGCLIYVVVTGKSPDFDRIYQAKNAVDLSNSIKSPEVATDLAKLIQKSLEFDPDERYQNCAELKGVLESIQKNLSSKTESEDSETEAKPSEEPEELEELEEQEEEQEENQPEEQDTETESSDQEQSEEDIESEKVGDDDSSIESVDVESSQEENEEETAVVESLSLPDIDSLLDTSEPEPEPEPDPETPDPELEMESVLEEPDVRDPEAEEEPDFVSESTVEQDFDSTAEAEQEQEFEAESEPEQDFEPEQVPEEELALELDAEIELESESEEEEEAAAAEEEDIQTEIEPDQEKEPESEHESESESESTPEQVDLAKLFSEDKLATVDGEEAADKERKQLKAISASGLNALIDFKRTATDLTDQTDQIQSPDSLLEQEEDDSAPEEADASSDNLTDREDFKSIAGAFRKKDSEKAAEENKPKVDFKGISDALFGDDDGLDAGQVAANIATASEPEPEPSVPVASDSNSVEAAQSQAQTAAPAAETVKIALPAEVEEISDSIGIARPTTAPADAAKPKSPQERVKNAAVASARRVASTMIAPAAKQNSYQKMVELGSSDIYTVYKAKETNTGTIVAAKTLKPVDEKVTKVFIRQAQKHSLLLHENIVRSVGSLDTSLGRPFFIMDYIKGVTLEDLLKSVGRIDTITEFAQIFEQICAAVEYAHGKNVVHGNLRPSNILLQEAEGRIIVKVLDFGMSEARFEYYKVTGEAPSANYALFMSPEQFKDEPLSFRSDIYQLGVLGFKMITGIEPVTGGSFSAIMNAILEQEATSADITAYRQDLRNVKILNQILDKAMRLDPEQRFQSVAELDREIARWVQNRPTREVDRAERESNLKAIIQDQVKLRQTQYDQEGTLMMKFTTLASGGARQSPIKATLILVTQIVFVLAFSGYVLMNFSTLKVKFQQMSLQLNDQLFNKKTGGADTLDSPDEEVILTGGKEADGKTAAGTDNDNGSKTGSDKAAATSPAKNPGAQSPHRSYRSTYVAPVDRKLVVPDKLPEGQIQSNRPVYPYLYTEEQVQKYSQRGNYKGRERPAAKGDSEVKVIK